MLQVYRYGEDFRFIEPVVIYEKDDVGNYVIPPDCTVVPTPDDPSFSSRNSTRKSKNGLNQQHKKRSTRY